MGTKDLFADLGAEQLLAAEKDMRRIAVEIKSFVGSSNIDGLEKAVGQYTLYHDVLERVEPDWELYLTIPERAFVDLFEEPIGKLLIENHRLRLMIFDPQGEEVRRLVCSPKVGPVTMVVVATKPEEGAHGQATNQRADWAITA